MSRKKINLSAPYCGVRETEWKVLAKLGSSLPVPPNLLRVESNVDSWCTEEYNNLLSVVLLAISRLNRLDFCGDYFTFTLTEQRHDNVTLF